MALEAAPAAERDLFVGSAGGDLVSRFDGETGAFLAVFNGGMVDNVFGVAFGNDSSLYVGDFARVLRYNSETGEFIGLLFQGTSGCSDLIYRPDNRLFVRFRGAPRAIGVLDGLTGAVIDEVLSSDAARFAFGPDGDLYVSSEMQPEIWRFDGQTLDFLGTFASGPLPFDPGSIAFGPGGDLYVGDFSDVDVYSVRRYGFPSGAYQGVFATPDIRGGSGFLQFGPDGNLYVGAQDTIIRHDGNTGAPIDTFATGGGMSAVTQFIFEPIGACCVPVTGTCLQQTPVDCSTSGGAYQGHGTACSPNTCPTTSGACCVGLDCIVLTEELCVMNNGLFAGIDVPCSLEPAVGACCLSFGCFTLAQCVCVLNLGTFAGTGVACSPDPCECTLSGDVNGDGFVRGDDITGYVRAKLGLPADPGENPNCADYGSGTLDGDTALFVQDLLGSP